MKVRVLLPVISLILFSAFFIAHCGAVMAPAIEWQKSFGGSSYEDAYSIEQTIDRGYIIAGISASSDDDVIDNHGLTDYWIVKLDRQGNSVWKKSFGGTIFEEDNAIQQTIDQGYIVAGTSYSNDGDVSGNHGYIDYWVVKLDRQGNIVWENSFGGSDTEIDPAIQQTIDGGYIVAGGSDSNDGDVSGNHGLVDYWVVKLGDDGRLIWQRSLGGSSYDYAHSIEQTFDDGYIVAGGSDSNDGDVSGHHGNINGDFWVVKLDDDGRLIWQKSLGGSGNDFGTSVQQTTDEAYIVAGYSGSTDGDVTEQHGGGDYWVVKLNANGDQILWQRSFGGPLTEFPAEIQQTIDGGYIIVGSSKSRSGDVTWDHGNFDYWVVKLNSNGRLIWQKSLGGSGNDYGTSIQQTEDGGYIVAGYSDSSDGDVTDPHGGSDYWVVKLGAGTPVISGTVSYSGPENKIVYVVIYGKSGIQRSEWMNSTATLKGRRYSIPALNETCWVGAFMDLNGNHQPDLNEPMGYAINRNIPLDPDPISVDDNPHLNAIDITLKKRHVIPWCRICP